MSALRWFTLNPSPRLREFRQEMEREQREHRREQVQEHHRLVMELLREANRKDGK